MKILKNYLYNASYQVFLLLVPLITTPYIARVLGPSGVGINAYTNSIIQYFVLFGSIGINLYGNREIAYHRDDPRKLSQIFWEIELLRIIAIIGACLAFFIFIMIDHRYRIYMIMQAILIIAAGLDISWFFMGIEEFRTTVTRNMIVRVLSILLIFTFVKSIHDIAIYIVILTGSQLIGNITLWPYMRKKVRKVSLSSLHVLRHLRPSIMLFIPQVAIQIYWVLNKTMLGSIAGVSAAGFFDNSDKMIKMVLAVVTATGTVMLPRVANTFAKGNMNKVKAYLYSTFDFVTSISIPMFLGLAAIAPKFSTWFFSEKFLGIHQLIMCESPAILMMAWGSVLGTQYLLPTDQTRSYTVSVTIGAVVNLLVNVPLIMLLGALGASISTVISETCVASYQLYVVRKQISLKVLFEGVWKYILSGFIMFIVVYGLNMRLSFSLINMVVEITSGIVVYAICICIMRAKIVKQILKFFVQ